MKKIEIYQIEGNNITRKRRHCPRCGDGVYLAEHKNRVSCGKCGYTEFKGKPVPKQEPSSEASRSEKNQEQQNSNSSSEPKDGNKPSKPEQ